TIKRSTHSLLLVWALLSCLTLSGTYNLKVNALEPDELEILWLANTVVTTPDFPIVFVARYNTFNISVHSSWGYNETITVFPSYEPQIYWISTPESSKRTGNVSFFVENNLEALYSYNVSWTLPPTPGEEPIKLTLVYDWFEWWVGASQLTATFAANGSVSINHSILEYGYGPYPEYLPYNQSFSILSNISHDKWNELMSYLKENSAYRWQSWEYRTPTAVADGGGYKNTITITWNSTTQLTISKMRDDDSDSGRRICTTSVASKFQNLLLDLIHDLIAQYFDQSVYSIVTIESSSTTPIKPVVKTTPGLNGVFLIVGILIFGTMLKCIRWGES
ncbi:MAG: hypothetical protein ACFFAE_17265, partial [Candidatus Hodarchaeota archaeon]